MSHLAARYRYVRCSVCHQRFDTMAAFRGHDGHDGEPCVGGTPGA